MTKVRIIRKNWMYYPQYLSFFRIWKYYYEEDLVLNGYFTTIDRFQVNFDTINECIEYINRVENENKIEVVYEN